MRFEEETKQNGTGGQLLCFFRHVDNEEDQNKLVLGTRHRDLKCNIALLFIT